MLDNAEELNWLQGFDVGCRTGQLTSVSHLLFADDTLIFCGEVTGSISQYHLNAL